MALMRGPIVFSVVSMIISVTLCLIILDIALRYLAVISSNGPMVVDDHNPIITFSPTKPFTRALA